LALLPAGGPSLSLSKKIYRRERKFVKVDIDYHVFEPSQFCDPAKDSRGYTCEVCGNYERSGTVGHVTEEQLEKLQGRHD